MITDNPMNEAMERARVAWLEKASDYTRLDESLGAAIVAFLRAAPVSEGMVEAGRIAFDETDRTGEVFKAMSAQLADEIEEAGRG